MRCLCSAEDYRQVLQGKHLLVRTKLARQYDRMAVEALHIIEVSRIIRSQVERGFEILSPAGHASSPARSPAQTPLQTNSLVMPNKRPWQRSKNGVLYVVIPCDFLFSSWLSAVHTRSYLFVVCYNHVPLCVCLDPQS